MINKINSSAERTIPRYPPIGFLVERFRRWSSTIRLYIMLRVWPFRNSLLHGVRRILDILFASIILIGSMPIMLLAAIAIKLESPGPVIFTQTRVGKWGQHFTCYKFRSMYLDAEKRKLALMSKNEVVGPMFKMQRDPRVTRVGRIIRKLSIDELPQLINVLKGEMSVVGPRPPLPAEVDLYRIYALRRLDALPGLTGLPQVSGRSNLDFERWIDLDLIYVSDQSLKRYVSIVLQTIPAVIFGRGAY